MWWNGELVGLSQKSGLSPYSTSIDLIRNLKNKTVNMTLLMEGKAGTTAYRAVSVERYGSESWSEPRDCWACCLPFHLPSLFPAKRGSSV